MFFQGPLQEGISTAVGRQKLVLCFVADETEESQAWENDYLTDAALVGLIQEQSVALRLQAGSDEAKYLAQIFPLPKTPTIVIMKHGELKEYIAAGTSKDDFVRRIQAAFSPTSQPVAPSPSSAPSEPANPPQSASGPDHQAAAEPQSSEVVSRVLAERAARLETQRAESERQAADARLKAKEKAKQEAEAGADTQAARKHQQAELVKAKRQQAEDERKRILKRIEDDKVERKLKREAKKNEAQTVENGPASNLASTAKQGDMASLQVRLFDGSTIRSRFKAEQTLKDVRSWVDEKKADKAPYRFKHVLTPLPNKNIDDTDEDKSLRGLDLAPSSTLVLVPVEAYVEAYTAGDAQFIARNVVHRMWIMIVAFFTAILRFFGIANNRDAHPAARPAARAQPTRNGGDSASQSRQDSNNRRAQQFFNGNGVNFESRPDES